MDDGCGCFLVLLGLAVLIAVTAISLKMLGIDPKIILEYLN